jgi:hypothetical protein
MSIRVVNNRKLEMTEDEWEMYQKIVQSYTDVTGKGEDLFMDLFEANDDGVIIFLKPPSKRRTSLEVFLFLMALMQHQHLRLMHIQIDEAVAEIKKNNKVIK